MIGVGVEIPPRKWTIEGSRGEKRGNANLTTYHRGQPSAERGKAREDLTPLTPPTSSPPTSTSGTGKEFPAHHPNADDTAARKVPLN